MVAILDFQSEHILAIFDLHVTLILPIKFEVNWPFWSGEEIHIWFSRWRSWLPSWISDWNILSYIFDLQVTPILSIKFRVKWPFGSGEVKMYFQAGLHGGQLENFEVKWPFGSGEVENVAAILDFPSELF